jgi:hypothetical protein
MTFDFLKNWCDLTMGIVPITWLEPVKILYCDQEKNWNFRIDWNGKLWIGKIVLRGIIEKYIINDHDKKNQEYGSCLRQLYFDSVFF